MRGKKTIQSTKSISPSPSSFHLLSTVFIVNFCIMTLQLVAGRMIAPYIGVSLYTWTAVIGIVLLGMSVGNYYGGKIADLYPKTSTLTALLLTAGVSALIPNILLTMFGSDVIQAGLPYLFQVLLLTSIFFFPSLILGSITPLIVKLKIN